MFNFKDEAENSGLEKFLRLRHQDARGLDLLSL